MAQPTFVKLHSLSETGKRLSNEEFREIGEAKMKKCCRARLSQWAMACDLNERPQKLQYVGPPRPKGRPRGTSKAQAIPPAPVANGAHSDVAAVLPTPLADLAPQEVASLPELQPAGVASEALPAENLDQKLLADPLCEVVYDEMDGEDKGEFKEIGEAQVKSRIRARSSPWAMADDLNPRPKKAPKKHYFGPRRGRGRPRGSGKAQAIPPAPVADGAHSDDIIAAVDPIPLADLAPQEVASVPEVQPEGVASEALPAARARGRPRQRQTPAPAESGPEETQSQAPADAELAPADLQNQLEDHAIPSNPRGPDTRNATQWEDITCVCGLPAGRKKFTNSPGNRDQPSWKISVRDNNKGIYASKGQGFTCRTEEACLTDAENQGVSLEDHIKNWVLERKQCQCTLPTPSPSPPT